MQLAIIGICLGAYIAGAILAIAASYRLAEKEFWKLASEVDAKAWQLAAEKHLRWTSEQPDVLKIAAQQEEQGE